MLQSFRLEVNPCKLLPRLGSLTEIGHHCHGYQSHTNSSFYSCDLSQLRASFQQLWISTSANQFPHILGPSLGYIQEWWWLVGLVPVTAFKVQRKPDYAGNGLGSPGLFNLLLVWLKFGHFCTFGSSLATSRKRADVGIPITN